MKIVDCSAGVISRRIRYTGFSGLYFIWGQTTREATISSDKNVIETRHAQNRMRGEPRLRAFSPSKPAISGFAGSHERRGVVLAGDDDSMPG